MNAKFMVGTMVGAVALVFAGIAPGQSLRKQQNLTGREASRAELLLKYDVNRDGRLDEEEVLRIGRDRLLLNDRNKDGKVDAAELKNLREKSRRMPQQDELSRAMARERALQAARVQEVEAAERQRRRTMDDHKTGAGKSK